MHDNLVILGLWQMGTAIVHMELKGPLQIVKIRHAGLDTAQQAQRDANPLNCKNFQSGLFASQRIGMVKMRVAEIFDFDD